MTRKCLLTFFLILVAIIQAHGTVKDTIRFYEIAGNDKVLFDMYQVNKDKSPDDARNYAELLLERIDSSAANPIIASMSDGLADYYETQRFLFSKAIQYRERSLGIYRTLNMKKEAAESEYRLAKLNFNAGHYDRTMDYVDKALNYFEQSDQHDVILDCYNLLGIVNYFCKDYDNSNFYFTKCAEEARKLKDSTRLMLALNNLAAFENNEKADTAKARSLIREGIRISKEMNDSANLFKMYLNLANAYLSTQESEKAGTVIRQIKEMAKNIQQKGMYYFQLGGYHYYLGQYQEAVNAIDSAIYYLEQGEFNQKTRQCLNIQWLAYNAIGDYKKAYEAVTKYIELEEQMAKEDVYLQIFRLQQDKIAQKEKADRSRRVTMLVFFLTVGILTAITTILLIYQKYRKRMYTISRQEYELKAKDAIMELRQIQQYQIDRLIETVRERLSRLSLDIKDKKVKDGISEICNDLVHSKDESQWKAMKEFVPDFNTESFQHLIKDFPNLTVNERRLCALLNKNLSTKEISMITHQSVNSITVARARLRNKFGLTGSQISLQEFLSKYN